MTSPNWPPSPDSDEGGEERARSQKVEAPAGGSRAGGLPCRSRAASAAEESCPLADARPSTRSAWYALGDVHILLARLMLAIAEADAVHPRLLGICTNGDPQFAAHNSRSARRPQRASERSEAILELGESQHRYFSEFHAGAMSMLMQRAFAAAARPLAVSVRPHKASVAGVAWATFFGGATARASAVPTRAAMWRTAGACAAGARLMSMGHLAAAQKSLDSIVKLESLRKEDPASIIAIWMEYHKAKDACAAAVMSRAEYDTVLFRGKKSPLCIAPVRKGAGHVTMVSHFK
ncbi:MAG: hypothetical protein ACPIOQ_43835, partial [Promethearchaeia archaeon]